MVASSGFKANNIYFWALGVTSSIVFMANPTFNTAYIWYFWGIGVVSSILANDNKRVLN
jgi:hypothetical protein